MRGWHSNWPDRWESVTIGDVVIPKVKQGTPHTDFTYIDIGSVNNKTKQIESTKELTVGSKIPSRAQQHVQSGDVLVSMTRPNLNAVAKVPTELDGAICSTGFDVLRPIEVEPAWLFLIVKSRPFVDAMASLVQGALYPAVRPADIRAYRFALPPLAEQRRIVAKIETLQERSRQAREALAEVGPLLEQFRQSVLAAAFRGDLTADWRAAHPNVEPASELLHRTCIERRRRWEQAELAKYEAKRQRPPKNWQARYEEPEPVDDSDLQELPDGWCWMRVAELVSDLPRAIQSGPFGSNLLHSEFQDTGILAVGIDNVHRDGFSLGQQHRISREKYEELKQYTARPLDVLVTVMATVGRCCLVPADLETAIITKHVYRITLEQRLINPHFLVLGFQGAVEVLKQLSKAIRGQTRPGINGEILKSLAIPVPPRQEQDVICEAVYSQIAGVNNISQLISETTGALDHLDQSILAKAFRGELVPQDPSNEPASVLLARIRQYRVQQAEATKGTKKTTNMQRGDAMRKKSSGLSSQNQPLVEVLITKGQPMPPEQLLAAAGYDNDSIEDFYSALREEIAQGHIREHRLTESDVMLEAVKQ